VAPKAEFPAAVVATPTFSPFSVIDDEVGKRVRVRCSSLRKWLRHPGSRTPARLEYMQQVGHPQQISNGFTVIH